MKYSYMALIKNVRKYFSTFEELSKFADENIECEIFCNIGGKWELMDI